MPSPSVDVVASGHPGLLTVAVAVDEGAFVVEVNHPSRASALTHQTGAGLAASLNDVPLYGRDLRLWLAWPVGPLDRQRLDAHCGELAEVTGSRVWVPPTGGWAVALDGCLDLGARAPGGDVGTWREYRPAGTGPGSFESDRDGRLVPAGGAQVRQVGGVSVVAVPPGRDPATVDRLATVWPRPGLCHVDLAILDDGRLAVPYADSSLLAVGSAELVGLLRESGWTTEDLCLLSPITTALAAGAESHLHTLATALGVDIYLRTPDSLLSIQDGHVRAMWPNGRPASWHRMSPPGFAASPPHWSNTEGWLEPAIQTEPVIQTEPRGPAEPRADRFSAHADHPDARPPNPVGPAENLRPRPIGRDRTELVYAETDALRSGVDWLPQPTPVNAAAMWLWVRSSVPTTRAYSDGVPAAQLFLVGHLARGPHDRDASEPRRAARPEGPSEPGNLWREYDLRMLVEAGAAVAASWVAASAPGYLRERLAVEGTYLVPAGWLDRVRLLAGTATPGGGAGPADAVGSPVVLRCTGAAHGVDGLPDEVVTWPHSRTARAYALRPAGDANTEFVAVLRQRPEPVNGHRLLELDLPSDTAIDVAATAERVAQLPLVRSRLPDLAAQGIDLLLPRSLLDQVRVNRAFVADRGTWRALPVPDEALDDLLVA